MVPLSDYAKNETYKELPNQKKYFSESDEKIFIDVRRSKGYSDEFEKLTRNDNGLTITIMLKKVF